MNASAKNYLAHKGLKVVKSVDCSDWHLTWGLGTNKIGKLHLLNDGTFFWYGKSQGRHGQKYGSGFIRFSSDLDRIATDFACGSLDTGELKKAVQRLTDEA